MGNKKKCINESRVNSLHKLNEDIKSYRIKASKDAEWSSLLSQASFALKKLVASSLKNVKKLKKDINNFSCLQ